MQVQCGFKFLETSVNSVCMDCTFVGRNGADFEIYKTSLMNIHARALRDKYAQNAPIRAKKAARVAATEGKNIPFFSRH